MRFRAFKSPFLICLLLLVAIAMAGNAGFSPEFLNKIARDFGAAAKQRVIAWQNLLTKHKRGNELGDIRAVNDFFNQLRFVSDQQHWKHADYWATPVEFLSSNGGDCEDFSIAKYFTLRELGIPDERLRITYVKALKLNQAHMVLAYYETPESEPLILDNLTSSIRPASKRPDLLPVYSFNGHDLWMSKERGQGRRIEGGSLRINLWRDLNFRMRQERALGRSYTARKMVK